MAKMVGIIAYVDMAGAIRLRGSRSITKSNAHQPIISVTAVAKGSPRIFLRISGFSLSSRRDRGKDKAAAVANEIKMKADTPIFVLIFARNPIIPDVIMAIATSATVPYKALICKFTQICCT